MKLPIKKKYFDQIRSGDKDFEVRDAHITFVCEETGETATYDVLTSYVIQTDDLLCPKGFGTFKDIYKDVITEDRVIWFKLGEKKNG